MDINIVDSLNQINKNFYKTVFNDFDNSRNYYWAGWEHALPFINSVNKPVVKVLDIGCGNGRFGEFLIKNSLNVNYCGLDNSPELLGSAKKKLQPLILAPNSLHFNELDVVTDPSISILKGEKFDLIVSFGVFHHIPSFELRLALFRSMSNLLAKDGILIISLWQFTKSENLMKRAIKRADIGKFVKDPMQLELGDYLLDWKRGKNAIRYCHEVGGDELIKLASAENLSEITRYYADGKNNDLNLYAIFKKI